MQNLLIPKGLRPYRKKMPPPPDSWKLPVFDRSPMPGKPFAWITDADGARELFPEELAKALGLPKSWDVPTKALTSKLLANTSSVFHWEYISQCLLLSAASQQAEGLSLGIPAGKDGDNAGTEHNVPPASTLTEVIVISPSAAPSTAPPTRSPSSTPSVDSPPDDSHEDFPEWKPPDTTPGGPWYCDRLASLRAACSCYDDFNSLYHEGIAILARHRENYDEHGAAPKA
jgi:hypothetical protein